MQVKFLRKVRKWGDSVVFSIPREILRALDIKVGDEIEVYVSNNKIVVEKIKYAVD